MLSRRSGVPVPTIKYYLRENLLPAGKATARNQARYDEEHLLRLRLIRTLTGIGRLDLSSVRDLLAAIDDDDVDMAELYQTVNRRVYPEKAQIDEPDSLEQARCDASRFVAEFGWCDDPLPASHPLVHSLAALRALGCDANASFLEPMAEAAERLAVHELEIQLPAGVTNPKAVAVVRTVLFEVAFAAARRMARERQVLLQFGTTGP
ncbi:MerR family transcriptional regulator [Dactylosporangium sp. NPDC000555]|uniref:MerR family transcriptional regulator n=1 Tax=Dactylosporangium sp. NPDC000555 TaxID=3154260 RepID=UPI003323D5CF